MQIFYIIFFLALGGAIGWGITYMWANFRYNNKKEIDKCYKERKEFKQENDRLKEDIEEYKENIKKLNEDIKSAQREIAEKNKYLSEDKVIVERLFEVKQLSDKISNILIDYDKDTIQHLLEEYAGKERDLNEEEEQETKHLSW